MTIAKGGLTKQTTADNLVVYEPISCKDPHVQWALERMADAETWEVVSTEVEFHKHYQSNIPHSVDKLVGVFPTEADAHHHALMLADESDNAVMWVRNNRQTVEILVSKLTR